MAFTETPQTEAPPPRGWDAPPEYHPVLLSQLQDELSRARLREAAWISIIFHFVLIAGLALSPRYWPGERTVVVVPSAEQLIRERELTYLEMPPDAQKLDRRPDTNIISDKDRIARKSPPLDRRELERILDSARPGAPGPGGPPAQEPPSPPAVAQAQPQQPGAPQPGAGGRPQPPPQQSDTIAKLEPPPMTSRSRGAFGGAGASPGSAIEQATRAAAASRGGGGGVPGGSFGLGQGRQGSSVGSNMEILSDTMGVDFGPYLSRILHDVRVNWYNLIPEVARAPLMKSGKVSIEFAITRDGRVAGMRLTSPSGDVSLDRAAWGGITGSNPFPPLPGEFRGQYLALRFHFFYNPDRNELR